MQLLVDTVVVAGATLLGPVLAVQAQKWTERVRDCQQRRLRIFRTLMATRATILSPSHVEAINAVPIEFYGKKKSFKEVVEAWKAYIDCLSENIGNVDVQANRQQDLFNKMIKLMAEALGYKFTDVEIKREYYTPKGHVQTEKELEIIRKGLAAVFQGEKAFPLDIKTFPSDPELQALLLKWLTCQSNGKAYRPTRGRSYSDRTNKR